ncbi:MAG TPA: transcription elongation factor GreA [Candidatus Paceibacterota bacterium]|jgi:transcription elongation factor GreA|nr:transcription elongation factor GreA [Candidatus Paceibacterota bacterium]HPI66571.1 transcription elongation factor GreA [Candidatus Paceibacterota bacterium]HQC46101.1 transcription elongation factor GreA [Candidatus Paceibacterota bacterium]HQM18656.1 transcription elongation factor GreA [Candidatus Paceibacterota bacterium]HQQ21901.1 transcription elongation factor GreA [Candidatus Paceibacterota bacterium]
MEEINYMTEGKKKELESELDFLKTFKRKEIVEALEAAKALGDLSENSEYHEARDQQGRTEDRIREVENLLKTAVIVKKHTSSQVEVGVSVKVKKAGDKEEVIYHIVGAQESDMASNKISYKSPLGQALMGKKKGEEFNLKTPKGLVKYTLIDIQ